MRILRMRRRESGSSIIEFLGLFPLVFITLIALVYGAFALYAVTSAQTAAREGARAYSLGQDPVSAVESSLPSWLDPDVSAFGPGHGIEVRVEVTNPLPGPNVSVTRSAVIP